MHQAEPPPSTVDRLMDLHDSLSRARHAFEAEFLRVAADVLDEASGAKEGGRRVASGTARQDRTPRPLRRNRRALDRGLDRLRARLDDVTDALRGD